MSDNVFRIVIAAGVGLTFLVFLVQAFVVMGISRTVRRLQEKVDPVADKGQELIARLTPVMDSAGPDLDSIGPAIRKFRAASEKIGPVLDKAGAVVTKIGLTVDQVTKGAATVNRILEDTRPRIAEISAEATEIAKKGHQQVERLGDLLTDASERARTRLEQIDHTVENTVEQVEQVGESMKRAVLRPVKEVNGIAAGISAAVSTLVKKPRKSSVDSATQDEEMFI